MRNWHIGIREKFSLSVMLLVVASGLLGFGVLDETKKLVVDHEIADLRDEAALRCWEMAEVALKLRRLTSGLARGNPDDVKMEELLEALRKGPAADRPHWWANIQCVLRVEGEKTATLFVADGLPPEAAQPPGAAAFVNFVTKRSRSAFSRLLPLSLPIRTGGEDGSGQGPRRLVPGLWSARHSDKENATIFVLMSLPLSDSPRHLAFLLNENGRYLLSLNIPGQNMEVDPFRPQDMEAKVDSAILPAGEKDAGSLGLHRAFKRTDANGNLNWRGAAAEQQVQRGPLLRNVALEQPFFFQEGRMSEGFMKAVRERENADLASSAIWYSQVQAEGLRAGWVFGGVKEGASEVRLLTRSKEMLVRAKAEVEDSLKKRFGSGYAVDWGKPVTCLGADVQLMRVTLPGTPETANAGGAAVAVDADGNQPDIPYWFAYCTFREEVGAAISNELWGAGLRWASWTAPIAGGLAFFFALWIVRPLIGITRTAQEVVESSNDALQNRIELVRHSLPMGRKDEVGDIARALDRLLMEMLNGHERLRQMNLDLEKLVGDRTSKLEDALQEIQGLAAAKDNFLASVSHELRQPLNSIFGFLQFVEFSDLSEQQAKDVAKIRHAASYLKGLIDDILDYQKIIMGGLVLEPEDIDAAEFFGRLQTSLEREAADRGNRLVLEGLDGVEKLYNDPQRLQQVLVNLLTNACKFTENGVVTLTIKTERPAIGHGEWLVLEVKDTGRGMKPEEQASLFTQFKKLASREGNRSGTGLGLVISQGLCKLMGGEIRVASEFGVGSTFTVRIPVRVPVQATEAEGQPVTAPALSKAPPRVAGRKVLVIDDDASVRELVGRFLKDEGCTVIEADCGERGVELAVKHLPDMITLDVVMPGSDGWEALAELKANALTAGIPVILCTFMEQAKKGYALGANDYIVKPIDWDRLRNIMQRHIGSESSVLVVDDEPAMREIARRTLEGEGWHVVEAADGQTACKRLEERIPAVILLDLMMPVMDGFEFMNVLRRDRRWQNIPVIAVTAMRLNESERSQLTGTVCTILQKNDFTLDALLAEVLRCAGAAQPCTLKSVHGQDSTS